MMDNKGKKAKVEEREEEKEKENEENEEIDLDLVSSIEKLQDCQDELEKLNDEASDKVLEVEQKYNEIRRPFYNKRNAVIQTIPDFWLTAFLSHPVLSEILTEEDQKVFKYLQSLDVEDFKDVKSGYKITLTFRANPYFEDSNLTKVFQFFDDGTTSITGTKPRWKGGMDLTNGFAPEKEGNKRAFIQDSFFKWLSTGERKDASEDFHDEVAEIIKDDLWPDPLKYFNNEADDEDEDDDEGDEGDEEEQGNGDGDEEDDDDDEDEDEDE